MLCMAEFQLLYLLRYLLLSWRRSQCPGWQGMPDIAHVRQLFSYFFSLLSYQSFLILKFFFLLFFIIIQSENLILSVLKLHQRADHAFEMTHAEWKSTDPPHLPQLPCLFSPPPQLSLAFHAGSLGDITSWTAPLRRIYWTHKNRGYLTRVITVCGPRWESIGSLLSSWEAVISAIRMEPAGPQGSTVKIEWHGQKAAGRRLGLKWLVSDVGSAATRSMLMRAAERDFQGKQHKEGVTVA